MNSILILLVLLSAGPANVSVGDVSLTIPSSKTHEQIGDKTRQFSFMESATPPSNRLIYLEAPLAIAKVANNNEVVDMEDYHVVQSFRQLEFVDVSNAEFKEVQAQMFEGMKQAMSPMTMDEFADTFNKQMSEQQGIDAGFKLGTPRLLGEAEMTDEYIRFTMLLDGQIADQDLVMVCRASVMPIKKRLIFIYSYSLYEDKSTVDAVEKLHMELVNRMVKAN